VVAPDFGPAGALPREVEEGVFRRRVRRLQELGVLDEATVAVDHRGVAPRPGLDEFEQVPAPDGLPDGPDLPDGDREVVLGEQAVAALVVGRPEVRGFVVGTDRTRTGEGYEVREVFGAADGQVAVVAGVQRVGGGVKEVTAQRGGEREHHGMAGAEQVHGRVLAEPPLRRDDDVHDVGEAVVVQERDDGADREDVEVGGVRLPGGPLAEVGVGRPLDGRGDEHLAGVHRLRDGQALLCRRALLGGPPPTDVRRRRDVDRRGDIRADLALEREYLGGVHVDLAVLRELERARVGHDGAREVEQFVQAVRQCCLPEVLGPLEYIAVRDEQFRAELRLDVGRRDRLDVRVHDRDQRRGPDRRPRPRDCQLAEPAGGVERLDLEVGPHCTPLGAARR